VPCYTGDLCGLRILADAYTAIAEVYAAWGYDGMHR
jgi:hypothetical protein